jgi:NACHT domain
MRMKLTSPPGPGADQKTAGRSGRLRQLAWTSVPLWSIGFLAFAPFLYLALIRRRIRNWIVFAAYLTVVTLFISYLAGPDGDRHPAAAAGLLALFMAIATVHAFIAFRPGQAPAPSPESHALTSPPGPGADRRVADRSGRFRQVAWTSVPLWSFGFLAFAPFLYLALIRRRIRDWAVFAAYLTAFTVVMTFIYIGGDDGYAGGFDGMVGSLLVPLMALAAVQVFIVLRPGSFPAPWRNLRAAGLENADPAVHARAEPAVNEPSGVPHEAGPSLSKPGMLLVDHVELWQKRSYLYEITETGWLILTGTGEVRFYKRPPTDMAATPDLRAPSTTEFAQEIWDGGVRAHFGDQIRNVRFTGAESPAISEEKLEGISGIGESVANIGDSSSSQTLSLGGDAVSLAIYILQMAKAIRARRRRLAVMRVWYPVLLGERPWPTIDVIKVWPPTGSEQAPNQQHPEQRASEDAPAGRASRQAQDQQDPAQAADQLAIAIGAQWEAEAAARSLSEPCPLPVRWVAADACLADDWDVLMSLADSGAGQAWDSPPGTWATGPDQLAGSGNHLVTALAQVPTGRLVVLGEPGTGKTTLMVRLALDLLASRTSGAPVPVLASLASWNPSERDLHDWLADQLAIDHPALATAQPNKGRPDRITALLSAGLILPILDGLDEIPEEVRGPAITRINDSLRPGDQLIVTCRTRPYRDAVQPPGGAEITLQAAAVIQLCPLDPADVSRYLRDGAGSAGAPARWDPVLAALGTKAPAGRALVTPLMVDLARTIYNPPPGERTAELRDPAELCRLHDRAAVEAHLLDAFIPAVYRSRSASRWDGRQAERWLVFLARHLETNIGTPDLAWWQLMKAGPSAGLKLAAGLVAALAAGVATGLVAALTAGTAAGVAAGLLFGTGGALGSALVARHENSQPFQSTALRASAVLLLGFMAVVVAGIAILNALSHVLGTLGRALASAALLLSGWPLKSAYDHADVPGDLAEAASPRAALARDRRAAFDGAVLFGFLLGFLPGLVVGIVLWAVVGLVPGFVFGFAIPILVGLYFSDIRSAWLSYALVRGWLALHRRLPWSLMDFLADAHQHGVLQQVGSVYQFRHIELQHRLATRSRPVASAH